MIFTEVPRPDPGQLVAPRRDDPNLFPPPLDTLAAEAEYWREGGGAYEEDFDSSLAKALAPQFERTLGEAKAWQQGVDDAPDDKIARIYTNGTTLMAFSRMWRQILALPSGDETSPVVIEAGINTPSFMVDFDLELPRTCGLHLRPAVFASILGVQVPPSHQTLWLEGEAVFVEVLRPAQPSPRLDAEYSRKLGVSIHKGEGYITNRPHLKRGVWPPRS